jgi:hypothetical protein
MEVFPPALRDPARAQLLQGTTNVREDARPTSADPGVRLDYWRRWEALFLLVLAANTVIATLAWILVDLLLK